MTERTALVCGAGLMGHGIGQVLAGAGYRVVLYEPELARAESGWDRIAGNLQRSVDKGRLTEQDRADQLALLTVETDLARAADGISIAIEAVFEDEAVKRDLLATATGPERRPRVVGIHFFSPVPVMPLIELIRGAETSDATEAAVRALAADVGKQLIVSRDRPGFIVNRILMPFLGEAMRAYEEGLGTAEDIDSGAKVGLNHPMGPLELADFIGLDVCLHIMEVLHEGFGAPHFAPPPVLRQLVDAGHLGQKSGRGFHTYPRS
jgi:3-hydroxybutyryl-CoA dehydrogenase